jgi:hypothetical protein
MDTNLEKYYSFINGRIVGGNSFGINRITTIESRGTYRYTSEIFDEIKNAINSNRPLPQKNFIASAGLKEYLDLFYLEDQNGRHFFALVYDNDALEQDPEIIEILKGD